MKKAIAYILANSFYYIGDMFGKLSYLGSDCNNFTFNSYQNFMHWSGQVQQWGGLDKPWGK